MAIAKSKPAPTLRTVVGARFTVMRRATQANPLVNRAARTRSRASRHAPSGWPTMVNDGTPSLAWTSTVTGNPSIPTSWADGTIAKHPLTDALPSPHRAATITPRRPN